MGNRFITLGGALALVLCCSSVAPAQVAGGGRGNQAQAQVKSTAPFDPHDFNGIWEHDIGSRNISRRPGEDTPPMTPWGQAKFDSYKPGYGPRMVPPATGNDPTGDCNPTGIPRILLFPRPIDMMQTPDRLMQVFTWTRAAREIWTDGRQLPKDFNPDVRRWHGYSVGRWEGNTLVVDSAGFDDRAWLDQNGYPFSEEMRLEERYTRLDHDTIELKMTVTDPKTYTKPWVAETKTWKLLPKEEVTGWYQHMTDLKGWYGIFEEICAPVDEIDNFNKRIRDPAGLGVK